MAHAFQCRCGAIRGHVRSGGISNRVVCYCRDCRAFALHLGDADQTLNAAGGTEIVQVAQSRLVFSQGIQHLAVLRLRDKGMLRWYASCCQTPLGNTLRAPQASFIGLIHTVLDPSKLDADFGPAIAQVHTQSAWRNGQPRTKRLFVAVVKCLALMLTECLRGRCRHSPLFDSLGRPCAQAQVLSPEQLKQLQAMQ